MLNEIMFSMNATKTYKIVDTWGYKDPKSPGGYNGMVGKLINEEADFGMDLPGKYYIKHTYKYI